MHVGLSLCINLLITIFISYKLLAQWWEVIDALGNRHNLQYLSITAMFVESAVLGILFTVPYIVLMGIDHPAQSLFPPVLAQTQVSYSYYRY